MSTDSPEREEAREALNKAVQNFVKVVASEQGLTDHPIVIGWVGYAEYTSVELQSRDQTGSATLVPDGQPAAMSRGLAEFAADAFGR